MPKSTYTRDDYRAFADEYHVDWFYTYISRLQDLVAEQRWNLKGYPRKTWYAFKPAEHGRAAFGIVFGHDTLYLYIKRVRSEASTFDLRMTAYIETYDQAEYSLEPGTTSLSAFLPLLKWAYERCLE